MAIEKMTMLSFVASGGDEQKVLEQLILSEKAHINANFEDLQEDSFTVHEYDAKLQDQKIVLQANVDQKATEVSKLSYLVDETAKQLKIKLSIDYTDVKSGYDLEDASKELHDFISSSHDKVDELIKIEQKYQDLKYLEHIVKCVKKRNIDFKSLAHLKNFGFQIGLLAYDNTIQIKKNYENISAIMIRVGEIVDVKEDIYLILYPNHLETDTKQLLKSVNWRKIRIPDEFLGDISQIEEQLHAKIVEYEEHILELNSVVFTDIDQTTKMLNRVYTRLELEKEVANLSKQLYHGNHVFVVRSWVPEKDAQSLEQVVADATDKYVVIQKKHDDFDKKVQPPTLLKNHKLFQPFEMIVKLYGLPSYKEMDPTPFLALTMCLMFGIMFGDIGQGAIYFLAGLLLAKKNAIAGGVLKRLGCCSIAFGFFYGSLFGLEQHQLPWLPSILGGSPLDPNNILPILISSVVIGVILLSLSYFIGIANSLRNGDIEHGVLGSHGIVGYCFYLSLVLIAVSLTGIIPIPPIFFASIMIVTLIIMILKEPIAHAIEGKKPLIKGDKGSYFIENGFEGLETLLSALSNAISFIRVGAFALNHAGLFMAFLVMADLVDGILLKVFIVILGNILILVLEGLVVFIQCLRLE
ncbi:MAG: hypothetical protein ATN31_10700, partial [Candidatus Epulonipiscioides saccharophilum]